MRLIVVDDDRLVVDSLKIILGAQPQIEVVGTGANGNDAVSLYAEHAPDIALLDIQMPGRDGLSAAREILERDPSARVVFLTTFSDDEYIVSALKLGARGFLRGSHDYGFRHGALLDIARGSRALDSHDDLIADGCVATLRAAEHPDAEDLLRTAVISYNESTFLLYHNYLALSMICTNLQRFVLLSGRVSMMRTVSPSLQVSSSDSATNLVVLFTNLP